MAYLIAAVVTTLSVLEGRSILQALLSAVFHIFGMSHSPSAFAELLAVMCTLL